MDRKADVIDQLQTLHDEHKTRNDTFRVRAYAKVLQSLKALPADRVLRTAADLADIPGLSQKGSIHDRIVKILAQSAAPAPPPSTPLTGAAGRRASASGAGSGSGAASRTPQTGTGLKRSRSGEDDDDDGRREPSTQEEKQEQDARRDHDAAKKRFLLPEVERARASTEFGILQELQKVHGVGAVRANELLSKYNVRSVADLREKAEKGVVRLSKTEQIGVDYFEDINAVIPRSETERHEAFLKKEMAALKLVGEVTGSFRRGEQQNGDIDLVLTQRKAAPGLGGAAAFHAFLERLRRAGYLTQTLAGPTDILRKESAGANASKDKEVYKWMGLAKLPSDGSEMSAGSTGGSTTATRHRRVDTLFLADPTLYPFTLLHFTGDKLFNIDLRNHALAQGYSLSEHGFRYVSGGGVVATAGKDSSAKAGGPGPPGMVPARRSLPFGGGGPEGNANAFGSNHKAKQYSERKVSVADVTKKIGKAVFETEEDIFRFLGLKYIPPEKRKHNVLKNWRL
mmetsp:Transcript_2097/g.4878  ORF Transcript_2097/g.4878 Transcript_2097/m.4878 type:complete len:512 (+) Transcript_2097:113-1648(+)|eukprot:CAMPEP_0178988018 /NCGR_PEP_ID=MMETSP0795-20121207/3585_1 /TAXON_ID=88552 /ORGANISM="Amoebophrya sp., Strain Ameob2" /LENGTH=511 /DNA_ID=CAMNT_0020679261 /DNA_START=71 /DNA_END=1606 /DNA_ORIENTATION=-